jgi:hypothetical protein
VEAALIILVGVLTILLGQIVYDLSRYHSREIYAVWYVWSLFFLVFSALYYYAEGLCSDLPDALEKAKDCEALVTVIGRPAAEWIERVYEYVTNIRNEVILVLGFVYLALGPQFLAYCLGALSGSATPPLFVRQIRLLAVMSLVKFLAGLSGILLAHVAAKLLLEKPINLPDVAQAQVALVAAFGILFFEDAYFERVEFHVFPGLRVHVRVPVLRDINEYLTRNNTRRSETEAGKENGRNWSVTVPVEFRLDKGLHVRMREPDFSRMKALLWGESSEPKLKSDRPDEREWQLHVPGLILVFRGPLVKSVSSWHVHMRLELERLRLAPGANGKFIMRLMSRLFGMDGVVSWADDYLRAASIATIWIDAEGNVGVDDVARVDMPAGRLAYCCRRSQSQNLLDRIKAWKRDHVTSVPSTIAENLVRIADEAGLCLAKHDATVGYVFIGANALSGSWRSPKISEEFDAVKSADPSIRYADFIQAKKVKRLEELAQLELFTIADLKSQY